MPEIVLATLNAKYIHAAFGLRYLLANLDELGPKAALLEFDINQRPLDIAEILLAEHPKIIGLGVYIWNAMATAELVSTIKRVQPEIAIVLGGPEVSFETNQQEMTQAADYVITGEADLAFAELCRDLLSGRGPSAKVIPAPLPDLAKLAFPYDLYNADDIAHRIIYVEASRGCPFDCEFCLSSLEVPLRQFPLPALLDSFQNLLNRGANHFKFVDRTFNAHIPTGKAILEFFLERYRPGLFLHFEMIPDRLPDELRDVIRRFPPGSLQFEVGVQSFNSEALAHISRRQNPERLRETFHFLRQETGVHIHADLIVGLPAESLESFGHGFDRLVALKPHEIQVGILKRLRGAPIARHDEIWGMVYQAQPPYELLRNKLLDFPTMQQMRRFARFWDLVGNSGNFVETTPLIWGNGSPFGGFMRFSQFAFQRLGRRHGIALETVGELLFSFLTVELGLEKEMVAKALGSDWQRGGRRDKPAFLESYLQHTAGLPRGPFTGPKRQARHNAK